MGRNRGVNPHHSVKIWLAMTLLKSTAPWPVVAPCLLNNGASAGNAPASTSPISSAFVVRNGLWLTVNCQTLNRRALRITLISHRPLSKPGGFVEYVAVCDGLQEDPWTDPCGAIQQVSKA